MPRLVALVAALAVFLSGCGDGGGQSVVDSGDGDGPGAGQEYEASATVLEKHGQKPELCLGGVAESYPPQCGGPPIEGWDWAKVPNRETAAGVTWASVYVRGTYDGEVFRLTGLPPAPPPGADGSGAPDFSPACETPDVVDRSHGSEAFSEAMGRAGALPEQVAVWVTDDGRGSDTFVANVVVRPGAGDEARRRLREHYGGPLCVVERDQRTSAELAAVQERAVDLLRGEVLTAHADERRGVVVVSVILATDELRRRVDREFGEGVVEMESRLRPVPSED